MPRPSLDEIFAAAPVDLKQPGGASIVDVFEPQDRPPLDQILTARPRPTLEASPSIGRTAFDQSMQGATFGFSDEISDRIGALIASQYTGLPYEDLLQEARKSSKSRLNAQIEENPATSIVANVVGGLLTGGAGASTKAGSAVANSLRTGNAAARIGKGVIAGAASGGLYGAGAADEGERLKGAEQGAALGGALGGALPAIGAASSGIKNAIFPAVDDSLRELADKAVNTYGIPLKRSQIGDSRSAKVIASSAEKVPLTGAISFDKKVHKSFNRAVLKTIGEDGDRVTPEVISAAYKNIGKKFDDVLKGQVVKVSDDALNRLADLEHAARGDITSEHAKIVQNKIKEFLVDVSEDGSISGEKIGSFRSKLNKTLRTTRNDASPFLKELEDLIVNVSVDGVPAKRELLNTARLQYKNLKTIEPLAAKAVRGNIQPSLLLSRVATKFSNFPSGGGGELGDLARIGQAFLKDTIPNSGTAERLAAYGVLGAGSMTSLPIALKAVAGSAAFNAANTSQKLVKSAIKNTSKKLPKTTGIVPAIIEGQLATSR